MEREYRPFRFKGGLADGKLINVPLREDGSPDCEYWRVCESPPLIPVAHFGKTPSPISLKTQEYRPQLWQEGYTRWWIFVPA